MTLDDVFEIQIDEDVNPKNIWRPVLLDNVSTVVGDGAPIFHKFLEFNGVRGCVPSTPDWTFRSTEKVVAIEIRAKSFASLGEKGAFFVTMANVSSPLWSERTLAHGGGCVPHRGDIYALLDASKPHSCRLSDDCHGAWRVIAPLSALRGVSVVRLFYKSPCACPSLLSWHLLHEQIAEMEQSDMLQWALADRALPNRAEYSAELESCRRAFQPLQHLRFVVVDCRSETGLSETWESTCQRLGLLKDRTAILTPSAMHSNLQAARDIILRALCGQCESLSPLNVLCFVFIGNCLCASIGEGERPKMMLFPPGSDWLSGSIALAEIHAVGEMAMTRGAHFISCVVEADAEWSLRMGTAWPWVHVISPHSHRYERRFARVMADTGFREFSETSMQVWDLCLSTAFSHSWVSREPRSLLLLFRNVSQPPTLLDALVEFFATLARSEKTLFFALLELPLRLADTTHQLNAYVGVVSL